MEAKWGTAHALVIAEFKQHQQPGCATLASYLYRGRDAKGIELPTLVADFPELSGFTKVGPNVPFIEPRTEDLGKAVHQAFSPTDDGTLSCDIVGVVGHGVVSVDIDPWRAFEHCERLEHICQIVLASGVY